MAHPFPSHPGMGNLYPASVAYYPFMFYPFILAAEALPVPFWPKNLLAEETVLLRPVGTVVDGLRLLHLSVRPTTDVLLGGQAYPYGVIFVYLF